MIESLALAGSGKVKVGVRQAWAVVESLLISGQSLAVVYVLVGLETTLKQSTSIFLILESLQSSLESRLKGAWVLLWEKVP